MKLSDLSINQSSIIKTVNSNDELKKRFYSFGLTKGATVIVEAISLAKNTIEINIEDTSIGMRIEEAKTIEVETIEVGNTL
ncbi:MAG: ferrous iron transport protein A [Arcobacteraceae bacterium]|nr:ferrous iron transport protein A [Arcobacteraceae bacterium]